MFKEETRFQTHIHRVKIRKARFRHFFRHFGGWPHNTNFKCLPRLRPAKEYFPVIYNNIRRITPDDVDLQTLKWILFTITECLNPRLKIHKERNTGTFEWQSFVLGPEFFCLVSKSNTAVWTPDGTPLLYFPQHRFQHRPTATLLLPECVDHVDTLIVLFVRRSVLQPKSTMPGLQLRRSHVREWGFPGATAFSVTISRPGKAFSGGFSRNGLVS